MLEQRPQFLEVRQHALAPFQELLAIAGELDTARCALKQSHSHPTLQTLHRSGDSGPWHLELFGRLGEAGQTRDADEDPQVFS